MRTKLGRFGVVAACVVVALLVVVLGITLRFAGLDRICSGVSVSGIDLGGLGRDEAGAIVQEWAGKQAHRDVTLTAMDRRWSGTLASLGVRIDWQDAVGRAYDVGRKGNILNRAVCVLTSGGSGKRIAAPLLIDRDRLARTLRKAGRAVSVPHKDAKIRVVESTIEILQDSCGTKLDEVAAVEVVLKAVRAGENIIQLPVISDPPDVAARDVEGIDALLASYTTSFPAYKRERTHNLTLASRSIDGMVLKPGQIFSYNTAVGPRIEGRGFQKAQIYIKGKLEDGIGGGICQVSSTLFNAALLAGLSIEERYPHCQVVPYVRPGRDATVAFGHLDFRFQNSNTAPIGVVSKVKGSRLTVQIYGSAQDKRVVKLYTGPISRVPAGSKTVVDATLAEGVRRVVEKGASGVSVVLYRKMTAADGTEVVEAMKSRYPAQKAVIAVGAVARNVTSSQTNP